MAASADEISYVHRWNITELSLEQTAVPPWTLLWSHSPIWFEKMTPGGKSESPGRRIANTSEGLVTVMKRTLYLLRKDDGKILWSLPLEGEEITDWKVNDNMFAYAAINWKAKEFTRAGVDIKQKKKVWSHLIDKENKRRQPEWLIQIPGSGWVYSTDYDDWSFQWPLEYYDAKTGELSWSQPKGLNPLEDKPSTWFTYDKTLNVLRGAKEGGLFVQPYDYITGKKLGAHHVFGHAKVGNMSVPVSVKPNGVLFTVVDTLTDKRGTDGLYRNIASMVAYSLDTSKLLWATEVFNGKQPGTQSVKQIASDRENRRPLVATISPNRNLLLNPENGTILRKGAIAGYEEWTELNALLYSYPYLYTSARRTLAKGFAYDLIALNLETGKIDWSYEIDKEDSKFSTATAEILNFFVIGNNIYLGRADGKIMCFQTQVALKH